MEKKFEAKNQEAFSFKFKMPGREKSPTDIKIQDNQDGRKARHHILGRKYIQLLFALALAVEDLNVSEMDDNVKGIENLRKTDVFGHLLRFACWDKEEVGPIISGNKPFGIDKYNQLKSWFFWSPYNLFIGPAPTLRLFDPKSGVEQTCPRGFLQDRWVALKAIPQFIEDIGIPLNQLVSLEEGAAVDWFVKGNKKDVKVKLCQLLKGIYNTGSADPHTFDDQDWIVVQAKLETFDTIIKHVNRQIEEKIYNGEYVYDSIDRILLETAKEYAKTFESTLKDLIKNDPEGLGSRYKFILRPREQ